MNDIQALFNAISDASALARSDYHLTLGGAIAALRTANPDAVVQFSSGDAPGKAMSYRGYYSDLAFKPTETATVGQFLAVCEHALGHTFEGYKGGDFTMTERTPLWAANYGTTGLAIVGIDTTGPVVILLTKQLGD